MPESLGFYPVPIELAIHDPVRKLWLEIHSEAKGYGALIGVDIKQAMVIKQQIGQRQRHSLSRRIETEVIKLFRG